MSDRIQSPFSSPATSDREERLRRKDAACLYLTLVHRGFHLARLGDCIVVSPKEAITPADEAAIPHHKPDLLRIVDIDNEREQGIR